MDRKAWHARIGKELRESPRKARGLATRYERAARKAEDPTAGAIARYFCGEADQLTGALRHSMQAYVAAQRGFEAIGETHLAQLVRISALQVRALLGDAAGFKRELSGLRRLAGDPLERATVEQAAGNGWRALGDEAKAERCFRSGLTLLSKQRKPAAVRTRALLRQDLGVALAYRGATGAAIREIERARDLLATEEQAHSVAMCAANLAWARGLAGQLREGWLGLGAAAEELDALGDPRRASLARLDAAEVRLRLGDFGAASEDAAREARLLARRGIAAEAGRAWLLVARGERERGRTARARQAARRARTCFADVGSRPFAAFADLLAGEPAPGVVGRLRRAGCWSWAVEALLDQVQRMAPAPGVRLIERELAQLPAPFRRWILPVKFRLRAQVEPAKRIPLLRKAVAAVESLRALAPSASLRATSLARYLGIYEELAAALLERGRARDIREAFWVLDGARARTLREDLDRESPGLSDSPAIRRVRERIETLWRVLDQRTGGSDGLRAASTPLLREVHREERELVRLLRDESSSPLASKTARPSDRTSCLAWSVVGGRLIGFLQQPDGVTSWDAGSLAASKRDLDGLRFQVDRCLYGATDHAAADALLVRLAARLLPRGVVPDLPRRLNVVLPMEIGSLPCEALPWNGSLLMDACRLENVPCAGWTVPPWRRRGGDLVVGLDSRGLPDVEREVNSVAALLTGAARIQGDAATRERVLKALGGRRVVHVAGHAEAREDLPPLSALRVRDGWITASDLATARLDGSLVVLSACRTGDPALSWFGESHGGFPRAVLGAGAAGVLASRWPVRDEVARLWMEAFYAALRGDDIHGAAAAAARAMRDRFAHVADWAAFLLVRGRRG